MLPKSMLTMDTSTKSPTETANSSATDMILSMREKSKKEEFKDKEKSSTIRDGFNSKEE